VTFRLPQPWPNNPWPSRFRTVRASAPELLAPGLRILTVQSPSLRGRGDLAIHVTPAAAASDRPPVVILLHGVYGSFWNWPLVGHAHLTVDHLVRTGQVRPIVLATPCDGLSAEGTAYLTHRHADYESWIIDDVVDCVAEFTGTTAGSPLFLGGNSMGGFGAARLGLRHGSRVSGIALHSAITHLDQLAEFTVDDVGREAGLAAADRDLLTYVDGAPSVPPIYLDCGTADPLLEANRSLHRELEQRGIHHEYHEFDGGHDWDAWTARLAHSLRFFESVLEDS
jgi:enterochelin esterase-like enzyme